MPAGNTLKLNRELIANMSALIREGMPAKYACHALGISEAALYNWLQQAREPDPNAAPETTALFLELMESIKQAKADRMRQALATITKAADESWQAAAWYLERTYPEEYSLKRLETQQQERQTKTVIYLPKKNAQLTDSD